jgi:hypothetical protein
MSMPPFDPKLMLSLIPGVGAFLKLAQDRQIASDTRYQTALDRLHEALGKTRSYVARLEEQQPEDRSQEAELALLWYNASVPCSFFDSDFAERCHMKGSYWHKPSIWSQQDIKNSKIGLDDVGERIRQMLLDTKNK